MVFITILLLMYFAFGMFWHHFGTFVGNSKELFLNIFLILEELGYFFIDVSFLAYYDFLVLFRHIIYQWYDSAVFYYKFVSIVVFWDVICMRVKIPRCTIYYIIKLTIRTIYYLLPGGGGFYFWLSKYWWQRKGFGENLICPWLILQNRCSQNKKLSNTCLANWRYENILIILSKKWMPHQVCLHLKCPNCFPETLMPPINVSRALNYEWSLRVCYSLTIIRHRTVILQGL